MTKIDFLLNAALGVFLLLKKLLTFISMIYTSLDRVCRETIKPQAKGVNGDDSACFPGLCLRLSLSPCLCLCLCLSLFPQTPNSQSFLDTSLHLSMRVCASARPSVHPYIRPSVHMSIRPLAFKRNRRERQFQPAGRIVLPAQACYWKREVGGG